MHHPLMHKPRQSYSDVSDSNLAMLYSHAAFPMNTVCMLVVFMMPAQKTANFLAGWKDFRPAGESNRISSGFQN